MRNRVLVLVLLVATIYTISLNVNAQVGRRNGRAAYLEFYAAPGFTIMPYDRSETSGGIGFGPKGDLGLFYSFPFYSGSRLKRYFSGWSFGFGAEFSTFQGFKTLNGDFAFPGMLDSEGDVYELRVKMANWNEHQALYKIGIPIGLTYQNYPNSQNSKIAFNMGFGLKFYIPLNATFNVTKGDMTTAGWYEQWGGTLMENLPEHGFGYYNDFLPNGKLNATKFTYSAYLQAGILLSSNYSSRSPQYDIGFSLFVEHGLNNLFQYPNTKELFTAPKDYSGFYNSNYAGGSMPVTIGVKLTYRIVNAHSCNCIGR